MSVSPSAWGPAFIHSHLLTFRRQPGLLFATLPAETSQITTGGRDIFIFAEQRQRSLVVESGPQLPRAPLESLLDTSLHLKEQARSPRKGVKLPLAP